MCANFNMALIFCILQYKILDMPQCHPKLAHYDISKIQQNCLKTEQDYPETHQHHHRTSHEKQKIHKRSLSATVQDTKQK